MKYLVAQLLSLRNNLSADRQGFKTSQNYQNFALVALVAPVMLFALAFSLFACQQKNENQEQAQKPVADQTINESEAQPGATINYDCGNCGMPSKDFPKWNTQIVSAEGEQWTCSPRCMFLITKGENAPEEITSIRVTEYYETKKIDGRQAFYVIKSSQTGPMGHDFVPFETREAAAAFSADYGGEKILSYDEVTLETVQEVVNYQPAE